jgi:hypothetical protein
MHDGLHPAPGESDPSRGWYDPVSNTIDITTYLDPCLEEGALAHELLHAFIYDPQHRSPLFADKHLFWLYVILRKGTTEPNCDNSAGLIRYLATGKSVD